MKYSITESKLESTIYSYINNLFGDLNSTAYVDDDGNEMDSAFEFYFNDYGDEGASFYWYDSDFFVSYCLKCPVVQFDEDLLNKLNSLFGDKWHTPFKKWLQKEYNLKVKTIQ
jgi:hypothetical protein